MANPDYKAPRPFGSAFTDELVARVVGLARKLHPLLRDEGGEQGVHAFHDGAFAVQFEGAVPLDLADAVGVHQHVGNTETYHILSGHALYNDNGKEVEIGAGTTTFCPDGETHGIKNTSKTEDLVFMALIIRK